MSPQQMYMMEEIQRSWPVLENEVQAKDHLESSALNILNAQQRLFLPWIEEQNIIIKNFPNVYLKKGRRTDLTIKAISSQILRLFGLGMKLSFVECSKQIIKVLSNRNKLRQKDDSNIKRRTYDCLNIMLVIGIIVRCQFKRYKISNNLCYPIQLYKSFKQKNYRLKQRIKRKQKLLAQLKSRYLEMLILVNRNQQKQDKLYHQKNMRFPLFAIMTSNKLNIIKYQKSVLKVQFQKNKPHEDLSKNGSLKSDVQLVNQLNLSQINHQQYKYGIIPLHLKHIFL